MLTVLELRAVADRRDDGEGDLWSDALDLRNAPARSALDKQPIDLLVEPSDPATEISEEGRRGVSAASGYRREFAGGVGQDLWDAAAGLVMLLAIAILGLRKAQIYITTAAQQLTIRCRSRALGHPAVRSFCEAPTGCAAARRVQITSTSPPSFFRAARTASHVRTDYPYAISKRFELAPPSKAPGLASMAIMVDATRCSHVVALGRGRSFCRRPYSMTSS